MPASEGIQQLAMRFTDPVQRDYEVIRGIMLADETIAERSRETGLDRATVGAKARRFVQHGRLHIAHREALLARYAYRYDRKARRLRAVEAPQLYRTAYASPQLELWELDDEQWRKVTARPYERRDRPADTGARQLALPVVGLVVSLVASYAG